MEVSVCDGDGVGSTRSMWMFSSCITTHPWSRALPWSTPESFLAQGTICTGDIFPPALPYVSFFQELSPFFRKYKALCLFWVRKKASLGKKKRPHINGVLPLLFCCLAWSEALSLSFLQNTDKVAKSWEALPVPVWEEGGA